MNPNGLGLRQERRRGQDEDKQSGFQSHAAHYNPRTRSMFKPLLAALLVAGALSAAGLVWRAPDVAAEQDWPFYGGDQGGMKFSTLADINASSVARLGVAWEW